jgi:hypothetical protein
MSDRMARLRVALAALPWAELWWDGSLLVGLALMGFGVWELAGRAWVAILFGSLLLGACVVRELRRQAAAAAAAKTKGE